MNWKLWILRFAYGGATLATVLWLALLVRIVWR